MLRIHQPTPTALSSDHCGSPLCMAGIMFNSSSSASEWKAHAKWHVDRPAIEKERIVFKAQGGIYCKLQWKIYYVFTLVEQLHAVQWGQRSEQAGMKAHGQQVPQPTLIKSLCTCIK